MAHRLLLFLVFLSFDGGLQIAEHLGHGRVVLAMEGIQFVEDVVTALDAGMAKDLAAGDHLEGNAAEAHTDPDMAVPGVLALAGPLRGQVLEVVVAADEVVRDAEDGVDPELQRIDELVRGEVV